MKSLRNSRLISIVLIALMLLSTTSVFAASSTAKLSGGNAPTKLVQGNPFSIKGTIKANRTIKRVEIGVCYYTKNKWTSQKYDNKSVYSKTFNVKRADSTIRFGKLSPGTYFYRMYAHTTDGKVHIVLNKKFTVVKKQTSTSKTTTKTKTNTTSTTKTVNTNKNSKTSSVKISGHNLPGTYTVGKTFNVKGTVSSSDKITRIEAGIVFAPTGKWTEYKYDKKINSKTFNLANTDSKLKFSKLPGGTYRYRIYAHTEKGITIVLNHKFTVKPSNKPQKAVNWGKKIANDNSFAYGAKPYCHDVGCYFCGTNKKTKPKGYEKTYVCLTFVGAAYAHGAGDKELLACCKKGGCPVTSNNSNFTRFSCWMKLGACREVPFEDLQAGDVIVDWSQNNDNGHVWMYIGGDSYVDAAYSGWGADTIAVRRGAKSYYKETGRDDKLNYVMRYRY